MIFDNIINEGGLVRVAIYSNCYPLLVFLHIHCIPMVCVGVWECGFSVCVGGCGGGFCVCVCGGGMWGEFYSYPLFVLQCPHSVHVQQTHKLTRVKVTCHL